MTHITSDTSKGQLVQLVFAQDAVAASQTDVQLYAQEGGAGPISLAVEEYYAPWPGEIVAVAFDLSAAGSAGNLSIGATINGTEDADTTYAITTAQRGAKKVPRGKAMFAAGQYIGSEITTDGSWNGTTADLLVTVYVLFYVDGI